MFRKVIFWTHLVTGVVSALVVLTMSFTGVMLTYERQILAWQTKSHYLPSEEQSTALPLEELFLIAKTENPELALSSLVMINDPGAPVVLRAGRSGSISLNPYTGEEMSEGSPALDNFFRTMTSFHRWFSITGENRSIARAITGACNLMFLFLILSGIYLWLPKLWKWSIFKTRLFFNHRVNNSKARDFNWHHVFGIWSAIPLAIIVATASVFSYGWANNLVYQAFGEAPPVRGPRGAPPSASNMDVMGSSFESQKQYLNMDQLFSRANDFITQQGGDWRQLSLSLPSETSSVAQFSIDQGNGGQPHLRHNLSLNRETGTVASWQPFNSQTPGRQARSIIRFLHTGEALGIWGQTIAGLVSLISLLMVWTGLALAYRRLIRPLFKK
ncbi:PepSY domain-containing protein [Gammaproteobacteria bacterium AH-315-E17]|nr:PepSY domain-containing protein [Gammaproteobacteria bacterium AH-315-E17]